MGNPKLKWTTEEIDALMAGVAKYGVGKWKAILNDSDFKLKLAHRTNVDLKDKWRNVGVTIGEGSGANSMTPEAQVTTNSVLPPKTKKSSSVVSKDNISINEKHSQSSGRAKNGPNCGGMILEALSSIKDRSGSDFSSILEFIEKRYEVAQNFRRTLSSRLRKLVMKGKLEKVHKRYKIKDASLVIKKPSAKRKTVGSEPRKKKPRLCFSAKAVEDASKRVAKHIAESEHKFFIAAEAIDESERISQMAEDSDAVVMHLKEIIEQVEKKHTETKAVSESERVAQMDEDSDAAIMHLKRILEQWEKTKQTA